MNEELNALQLPDDVEWENEDKIQEGVQRRFARGRLFYVLRVDRFIAGSKFTLPDVYYDKFDNDTQTSERIGLKEFGPAMRLNPKGKWKLAILVTEEYDKNNKPYHRCLKMPVGWVEKDQDGVAHPNIWNDFQKSEIASLTPVERNALVTDWEYFSYDKSPTGYDHEFDPKSYVANIQIYKSVAEWQAASEAHFAQFSQNGQSPEASYYPDDWGNAVEDMIKHGKELVVDNPDVDHKELATTLQLLVNGDPAQTADGKPCNVKRILAEVLDCPEPMVKI